MSKYINADRIKSILGDVISELQKENQEAQASIVMAVLNGLNEMPAADVVEVVRCKDCIHLKRHWCMCEELPICGDDATTFEPDEDFFCKYGERKETE